MDVLSQHGYITLYKYLQFSIINITKSNRRGGVGVGI